MVLVSFDPIGQDVYLLGPQYLRSSDYIEPCLWKCVKFCNLLRMISRMFYWGKVWRSRRSLMVVRCPVKKVDLSGFLKREADKVVKLHRYRTRLFLI